MSFILLHATFAIVLGTGIGHWLICRRLAVFHDQQEKSFLQAAAFGGPGVQLAKEAAAEHGRLKLACESSVWRIWEAIPIGSTAP